MGEESREYRKGFAAGWLAASRAIMDAMSAEDIGTPSLEMAGNMPGVVLRRRGRPPKSAPSPHMTIQEPVKRRRGRPPKAG